MTEQLKKWQLEIVDNFITWGENEVRKLKAFQEIKGDPDSITRGGMIKAHKNMLLKLRQKRDKLLKY